MVAVWLLPFLVVGIAVGLSFPVGVYLARIMDGRYRCPLGLRWLEQRLDTGPQNWKQYSVALLLFSTMTFVIVYGVLALHPELPLNPENKGMLAPTTIFHTTISFVTNNSQQHYAGEQHLSYFSQLVAIVWSMFVSGGVGFCALAAINRGLRGDAHLGNFYLDLCRAVVYALLPSSLILAVMMVAAGVPMTLDTAASVETLEPCAMGQPDFGSPALPQRIARGPVAALVPIKNLASVGGGFFGANSAHPFENPDAWANILTCVAILLFPCALVVTFGRMLNKPRHAGVLYAVMLVLLGGMIGWTVYWDTLEPNPALTAQPDRAFTVRVDRGEALTKQIHALAELPVEQELGNLEGKELRFGTSGGATFAAVTTAVSCGSVNCAHDSLNPLAGLRPLIGMWLCCVVGGKGIGLINLLLFLIVGIFFTGLMVGRTPEYLSKKVEAREMKLAMVALLIHPLLILGPTGLFAACDWGTKATNNPGAHGFSEVLYEFSSASSGNGSGFEGLGDTWGFYEPEANSAPPAPYSPAWDIAAGLGSLLGRYVPIVATINLAGSLAGKLPVPFTVGTLRTDTLTFGIVLLMTILLLGALLFLPAAVLGPVADHLGPIPFGG